MWVMFVNPQATAPAHRVEGVLTGTCASPQEQCSRCYRQNVVDPRRVIKLALLIAMMAGVSCGSPSDDEAAARRSDAIVFPVQNQDHGSREAELIGTLVREGRCLYIRSRDDGVNYLPVWPEGSSYESSGGKITVVDSNQQEIAVLGERVSMGGGVIGENKEPVPQEIEEQVDGCEGPYWIVGRDD